MQNEASLDEASVGFGTPVMTDLAVPDLMAGLFGTRAWMARRAGRTTSPAKAEAARRNGAKGGRPRKPVVA